MSKGKVTTFLVASVVGGAVIGGIAALAIVPFGCPFGVFFGATFGLAVSPWVTYCLRRKPFIVFIPGVFLPALFVALLAASSGSPPLTLLSVVTFFALPAAIALVIPDDDSIFDPGKCRACGYEIAGLTRCPECGRPVNGLSAIERPGQRVRWAVAVMIALVGFVLPLGLAGAAAYDELRPKTTAEYIRQLGDNDMERQHRACVALTARPLSELLPLLNDPNPGIRANAALTVAMKGDPDGRAAIAALVNDPVPWVSERARAAVELLDSAPAPPKPH